MLKIGLASLLFLFIYLAEAQTKNFLDLPYIEVNGIADTLITPNEIFIKVVLLERDTKDRLSVQDQEIKMVKALKSLGIDTEKNLTINDMGSNYKFYITKGKEVVKAKNYVLKVGDAVMVSKVFMKLEDIDISNATIDHVNHSAMENIRNIMRIKAVKNAKTRALALTRPIGQSLGQALHITDNEGINVNNQLQGRMAGITIRGTSSVDKKMETPLIEFEKIKVTSAINVKFILK